MHNYINKLTDLISDGVMENTYKMCWCRALVEHSCNYPNQRKIHFDNISELMFKYYWDQTIFFDLEQGPNTKKRPAIHQIVRNEIEKFKEINEQPINFIRAKDDINIDIKKISTILTYDVSWKFKKLGSKTYDIYDYKKGQRHLILKYPKLIKKYSKLLFQLINYRWSQKLENLNNAPRIAQKVRGVDRDKVPKRKSLKKFRRFLDLENPNKICFLTNTPIEDINPPIDHVIPWSYMYSDDLWNLVYVNRSINSSMSNRIKKDEIKNKLIKRNTKLLQLLDSKKISNKEVEELRLAIDKDYVQQFWIGSKG